MVGSGVNSHIVKDVQRYKGVHGEHEYGTRNAQDEIPEFEGVHTHIWWT